MTIDKAIEILDCYLRGDEPDFLPDLPASIRLGIEALEGFRDARTAGGILQCYSLPGETERGSE